ncbi:hypothetical protein [Deinococcus sp. Leaf326]|uniref:hypothetical protein n=1 Tax=Deinococcus sp. Leaf326 TaxID=1736338 RepID=UPI0006FEA24D|nr:hypothetical protein [Deinococcus sp. Leaf326]KQR37709.1 hypothetical protein ASF71_14610 [Deinococcus sp. Leaf326]
MDGPFLEALTELQDYEVFGSFAVVEGLVRLERIAKAALAAHVTSDELRAAARHVMDRYWNDTGSSPAFLERRRAEVLLRLDTMLDHLEWEEQRNQSDQSHSLN